MICITRKRLKNFSLMAACILGFSIFSCQSMSSYAWYMPGNANYLGTVRIRSVLVEKLGNSQSIEEEMADILPMIFADYGFIPSSEKADFIADVQAREREYTRDWKTERSLSMEIRLRLDDGTDSNDSLPFASGQVTSRGNGSLSSSSMLRDLLGIALGRTAEAVKNSGFKSFEDEKPGAAGDGDGDEESVNK
jgi:hypothetical protein